MRPAYLRIVVTTAVLVGIAFGLVHATDTAILTGNHPPEAETLPSIGDANPGMPLSMQIRFATRNQADLNRLLAEQQNPSSPNFHRWLKPGEYQQRFGPAQPDVDAVAQWLKGEGFAVESMAGGSIEFSGTVAQAEHAFAIRIARFGDGKTYANVNDPAIPARFAGAIGNILGLDNMMHAVPVGPSRQPPKP